MLSLCTFTGVDGKTDLNRIIKLHEKYQFLEFGVLYTNSPDDKDERYMSPSIAERVVEYLSWSGVYTALHICGRAVDDFLSGENNVLSAASKARRIQLNFKADKCEFSPAAINKIIMARSPTKIITQHFPSNFSLYQDITAENHQILHDLSAGRGIATEFWQKPFPDKPTGYAGGLGPNNIANEIGKISTISGDQNCWIDMESGVRKNGYFSLDLCEEVAKIVAPYMTDDYKKRRELVK